MVNIFIHSYNFRELCISLYIRCFETIACAYCRWFYCLITDSLKLQISLECPVCGGVQGYVEGRPFVFTKNKWLNMVFSFC